MASKTVKAIRAFRDAVANVDFSPLPGVYDSIPWEAGDAALKFLEATTDKQIATLLKERFPWLGDTDEIEVSGSDAIDQLSVWYSELTSAKATPPVPTLQEYFTEKMGDEPDRALPDCALDSVYGISCVAIIDRAASLLEACAPHTNVVQPILKGTTIAVEIACFDFDRRLQAP